MVEARRNTYGAFPQGIRQKHLMAGRAVSSEKETACKRLAIGIVRLTCIFCGVYSVASSLATYTNAIVTCSLVSHPIYVTRLRIHVRSAPLIFSAKGFWAY